MEQEFASEIQSICSNLLEDLSENQNEVDYLKGPFTKLSLCMYIGALYYSIDNEEFAYGIAYSYKIKALNEKQKEFFQKLLYL